MVKTVISIALESSIKCHKCLALHFIWSIVVSKLCKNFRMRIIKSTLLHDCFEVSKFLYLLQKLTYAW